MKRLMKQLSAGVVLSLSMSALAFADDRLSECREYLLNGLYVFSATGYTIVSGVAQPKALVELIRFNGDGTLSVPGATRSINGVIAQSPSGGTGTYVLDADCRGSLGFTGGPTFDIFAAPNGTDLWMIQTNPNNIFQGNVTKVSH
jgi:hypothetical protein